MEIAFFGALMVEQCSMHMIRLVGYTEIMYEVLSHILNAFPPKIFLILNYVYVRLGGGVMCTAVLVPWMPEALVLPETEDTGGDELTIWLLICKLRSSATAASAFQLWSYLLEKKYFSKGR